jgi:predicted Fe-Mo cluster-binding NifX family protein
MTQDEAVVVEKFSTRMEAQMAAGLLEAEGIYSIVSADDAGGAYPPLQHLGVRLIIFPEDERRAREILADWRAARDLEPETDEETEDEAQT